MKEVGGPSFFALLVIAVSFLPVLTLEAQEGRLFKPLAYTKNFSMIIAAVLAITLDPAMRLLFTHMKNFEFRPRWMARVTNAVLVGKIHSEENHPISRILIRIYEPVCAWSLRWKWVVIAAAWLLVSATVPIFQKLGSEFMPPLDEGALLYMPSTLPGISITEAQRLMQAAGPHPDAVSGSGPVLGKAGRAETSTDPAPLSMMETIITLKPPRRVAQSAIPGTRAWAPEWVEPVFQPHHAGPHLAASELVDEMNEALRMPGTSKAWTMPIKEPHRHAHYGHPNTSGREDLRRGHQADRANRKADRRTAADGVRERAASSPNGPAAAISWTSTWNRDKLARYGFSMDDAQAVVMSAIGGENVTTTVEGRERYPVNVRYHAGFPRRHRPLARPGAVDEGGDKSRSSSWRELKLTVGPVHAARRERPVERLRVCGRRRPRYRQLCG